MSFQPSCLDVTSGTVAVVGSSANAVISLRLLRSAGANVRWYCGDLDVAEAVLLASAPPGHLELSFSDPLQAEYRDFTAIVAGTGGAIDQTIADRARANNVPVNVVDQPALSSFTLPTTNDFVAASWRNTSPREIAA
jgi:uroporphyrin-III C-methyltransferase / precorrin-2 dehydrogenase / sirohydrochlorin ferrochelatase